MTLLTEITLSPTLIWSIISLLILQAIAFGKFILSLSHRLSLVETGLEVNTESDTAKTSATTKELEELRVSCIEGKNAIKIDLNEKINERKDEFLRTKNTMFKRIKEVEDKSDINDKEVHKRCDFIGQGLKTVEAQIGMLLSK